MIDFSQLTYRNILDAMLGLVSDDFDKRDTSPIQTALGPAAYGLQDFFLALNAVQEGAYITTATGLDLDALAWIARTTRWQALPAYRRMICNTSLVPIGARFSTIGENAINYYVYRLASQSINVYRYDVIAETPGTIGNDYTGPLLPIETIPNLQYAEMTDILIPGRDEETDEVFRARIIERMNSPSYGGNIASYREFVKALSGVGEVQVYPTWNGGGTVKLSIIGADWNPASADLVDSVQTAVDPNVNNGGGIGMAPIGAVVLVTTPTTRTIDVTASLLLENGYDASMVQDGVEKAIEDYLLSLRKDWATNRSATGVMYSTVVYRSQIIAALVQVDGVINVSSLLLNNTVGDVSLTESALTQEVPVLGTVTL